MDTDLFIRTSNEGVATGDWSLAIEWLSDEASFAFKSGTISSFGEIPSALLDQLLVLLKEPAILEDTEISYKLLFFIESEWQRFSEAQRQMLLPILGATYSEHRNPMAWYVISELLGEYFANSDGLSMLLHLVHCGLNSRRVQMVSGLPLYVH